MRIGLGVGDIGGPVTVDKAVEQVRSAAADGFPTVWAPQVFGLDALTTIAVAGHEVAGIELGTSVVPTYPRHPAAALGIQAATVNQAVGGRLVLGIGLSHQPVIEGMLGYSFDKPVRHMREYLELLLPFVREGKAAFEGETLKGFVDSMLPQREPFPVIVAALGPQMLELAGRVADGTITWMTGPRTLADHVVPSITKAADAAGQPAPRVVAGFPVGVTDDPDAVRELAARVLQVYGMLPSYRAMLDREGVDGPADLVICGDEATVGQELDRIADAGVTDLWAVEFGRRDDDRRRTRDLLKSRL
jgi:F420-dependent oxidoreductase-like protein